MNLLFYRYGSICEPDIIAGFEELGNHVSEITLEIYDKETTALKGLTVLKNELLSHSYDFVFSINFYPFISEVCNIFHIRYICWTVDCPVMELYSNSLKNPWNRIFLFDKAQYDAFHPKNPNCIFHLPLASNPKRWHKVLASAPQEDCLKYTGTVSFVGSLYTEKCPYDRLTGASDYLRGYLEGIMEAQSRVYGCYFLEELLPDSIVESFRACLPGFYTPLDTFSRDDRAAMAQLYLCAKISAMERVRTMQLLGSRYPVNLYTASGTSGIPVKNCGLVKTLTEMPLVFHHSKINLNITAKAIRTALPLRIFDVLACEGFLLTNYQSELADCFEIGSDLVCYTDEEDLLSKTDYYLTHETERREIAHNGLTAVTRYHNYPERLLQMLSLAYGITTEE